MNTQAENVFFKSDEVVVTNARFIVGAQTFAMGQITSVEGVEIPASYGGPVCLVILGLILFAWGGISSSFVLFLLAVLTGAFGIWKWLRSKPTFTVVLRTAGGEITAYSGHDKNHIWEIIQALNNAIVARG